MKSLPRRGLLAAALFACCQAGHADPIIVTATRAETHSIPIPASISVISRSEIEASGARDLAELLRSRSGLEVRELFGNPADASIDMRGFGPTAGQNTLVLVDGRPLNNSGDLGAPDLDTIPLARVERVEIIQGSAGILYGNQAVGGLINIITRRPSPVGEVEARAAGGSYNGRELILRGSHKLANGFSARILGRRQESDNYRDHAHDRINDLDLGLGYEYGSGTLRFQWQEVRDRQQTPGSLLASELRADRRQVFSAFANDFENTATHVGRLSLNQAIGERWLFAADLTQRRSNRHFVTSFRSFGPGSPSTLYRRVRTLDPRFIGRLPTRRGDVQLTLGSDIERTDYRLHTTFGATLLDQSIDAIYAQGILPLGPGWSTTLGVRRAWVRNDIRFLGKPSSLDDRVTAGSAGVVYRPNGHWRLFARADQNYRFATADEHTNVVFGKPVGLKNQTGVSLETGLEFKTTAWDARLVGYRLNLRDEIAFDSSGFANINLDHTRRVGAILEANWHPARGWRLGASYSHTSGKVTSGPFTGKRIPLVARQLGHLDLEVHPLDRLSLYGEIQATGAQVLGGDFNNSHRKLPGYGIVNLRAAWHMGGWQIAGRIDNLLDRKYSESGALSGFPAQEGFYPAPERHFWIELGWRNRG